MHASDPGTPILLYAISGLIFSLGLFLLLTALRGKRIDDHPWCRKCKFDLFGRSKDADNSCPECGCDLSRPNAVRVGQRQKRRGMLAFGLVILLLGVAGLGVNGYVDAVGIDWQRHKPVWLLMREANGTPGNGSSDSALHELRRRYDAGLLSAIEIEDMIEAALVHQLDPKRPWQTAWGNFVELGRLNGDTTDDQWQRYAEGILTGCVELEVRPKIAIGSTHLPVKMSEGNIRMGDEGRYPFWMTRKNDVVRVGPASIKQYGSSSSSLSPHGGGSSTSFMSMDEHWDKIKPGKHDIIAEVEVSLTEGHGQQVVLASRRMTLSRPAVFLESGKATVTTITDPGYRDQVKDAITIKRLRCYQWSNQQEKYHLDLNINFEDRMFPIPRTKEVWTSGNVTETSQQLQTIDLAFEVVLRHGDKEYGIGWTTVPGNSGMSTTIGSEHGSDLVGEKVDVILRPSVMRAETSIDCFEIWGGEIVFEGVPVEPK